MKVMVNQGDTLSKILRKNNIEVTKENLQKVAKDNNLESPDKIKTGQKLTIAEELRAQKPKFEKIDPKQVDKMIKDFESAQKRRIEIR